MATMRFYDEDGAIYHQLRAVAGPVNKGEMVIGPDTAADMGFVNCFASTVVPNDKGGFYWYYSAIRSDWTQMRINLAESADGLTWEKPKLGQELVNGEDGGRLRIEGLPEGGNCVQPIVHRLADGRWRMYFWLHRGGDNTMVRYITAESSDGIRWRCDDIDRVCIYHPSDKAVPGFDWAQGLVMANVQKSQSSAEDLLAIKRKLSNDATFVIHNEFEGCWEMYSIWLLPNPERSKRRCEHDNAPPVLRTIHRRVSEDGLNWSDPELIIVPDGGDPLDQQFYHLAVHWQGRDRIGFLGNYRLDEQTMDLELCFSRDGLHWDRPLRGGWIPRGAAGADDSMAIYPTQGAFNRNGIWYVPYHGGNIPHNAFCLGEERANKMKKIMTMGGYMAQVHEDRLMGRRADGVPGYWQTKPFIKTDEPMTLDAAIDGEIRYSLCNAFGEPFDGYSTNDCVPLTGDSHQHQLRWREGRDAESMAFDAMVLRLELRNATVYTLRY